MMMKRLISTWWTCGSMVRPLNAVAVGLQGQSARDSERLRGIADCRGLDGGSCLNVRHASARRGTRIAPMRLDGDPCQ
jgi:hypothetical protein